MTSTYSSTSSPGGCNAAWTGDMYCDDINNNMDCNYDGGDCCGCNVNTQYCSVCGCLDPNGSGTTCPQTTTLSTLSTTHGPGNYALALKLLSPGVMKIGENESSDFCKVSCIRGHENWRKIKNLILGSFLVHGT